MEARIREELIRRGDAAFEEEDFHRAREFYTKADHKEGLIRIGDFYMFERRLPLMAYGYYKKAGAQTHALSDDVLEKWKAIARDTAWKDYAAKNAGCAKLIKLAQDA